MMSNENEQGTSGRVSSPVLLSLALLGRARGFLWPPLAMVFLATLTFMLEGYRSGTTVEKWDASGSLYLSLITALTIGYGDLSPAGPCGRFVAVLLGFSGILVLGVVVAAVTKALERTDPAPQGEP